MSFIYPEKQLRHQIILDAGVIGNPLWMGERITWLINQAQRELQLELIRKGYGNWIVIANQSLANTTALGIAVSRGSLPKTYLKDLPPIALVTTVANSRPVSWIDVANFVDIIRNPYSCPTSRQPIGFMDYTGGEFSVVVYPATGSITALLQYHKQITDLVYNENATQSEIPIEHIPLLIKKVIAEIKVISTGDERTKQAKLAEIDKRIKERYQLSKAIPESEVPEKEKKVME